MRPCARGCRFVLVATAAALRPLGLHTPGALTLPHSAVTLPSPATSAVANKEACTSGGCGPTPPYQARGSPGWRALSASKDGRSLGLRAQHSRMTPASGPGQLDGIVGRRPFCTTPTAACGPRCAPAVSGPDPCCCTRHTARPIDRPSRAAPPRVRPHKAQAGRRRRFTARSRPTQQRQRQPSRGGAPPCPPSAAGA